MTWTPVGGRSNRFFGNRFWWKGWRLATAIAVFRTNRGDSGIVTAVLIVTLMIRMGPIRRDCLFLEKRVTARRVGGRRNRFRLWPSRR